MAVAINPFSAKCGQGQNSTKIPKFCLVKFWKQILPFESGGRKVSFEWSHHRILFTDSKVKTTIRDSNIHSDSKRVNLSGERRLATALCTHWSPAVDWVCDLWRDFRWRGVSMRFSPRSKLFQGCHLSWQLVHLHHQMVPKVSGSQHQNNFVGILCRLLV